jgi:calcineurin-like phosphoesterase family protein
LSLEMDEVCACLEFEFEGVSYFLTHQPVKENVLKDGQVNIHGHIHNTGLHPELGDGSRHLNISVECIGFMPRTLKELLAVNHPALKDRA